MKTMLTKYAPKLDEPILIEYPRPQLRRDSYLNLNGLWAFEISQEPQISQYTKQIVVPFSPESILSRINQIVLPDDYIFYQKIVTLPVNFIQGRLILHFGAVDQTADIYINQVHVKTHVGGYVPFSIDITPYVSASTFELSLRVQDVTDTSYHLTGKQRLSHSGIFYTPQSGIWQTVWLESVPEIHIEDLTIIPDFYNQSCQITVKASQPETLTVAISYKGLPLKTVISTDQTVSIKCDPFNPWSPETPNLYDLTITYGSDVVYSYVGIRSYERKADSKGIQHFYLNGKPYFQAGVLDQGYFSDGLLTPPSDQAMIDDILTMKSMGFNMLRKHIKMEPLRWYYHCDRLGMLVWQDMMSGCEHKNVVFHHVLSILHIHLNDRHHKLFGRTEASGKALYQTDLETMIHTLKNVTSICTWVPFNEAWGQFDTVKTYYKIQEMDSTRLIDHASGWSDHHVGDYHSRHIYYQPIRFSRRSSKKRILALTEFGGYSLPIEGHQYDEEHTFGYKVFKNATEYQASLSKLYTNTLIKQVNRGLSVLVYTQLSDVESEINGFLTYDRAILKIDPKIVRQWHNVLIETYNQKASAHSE